MDQHPAESVCSQHRATGHSRHSRSHLHFYATWSCKWPNLIWPQVHIPAAAAWVTGGMTSCSNLYTRWTQKPSRKQGCLRHTHQLHASPRLFYPFCNPGKKYSFLLAGEPAENESLKHGRKAQGVRKCCFAGFPCTNKGITATGKKCIYTDSKRRLCVTSSMLQQRIACFQCCKVIFKDGFWTSPGRSQKGGGFSSSVGASEHDHVETNTEYSSSFLARTSSSL